ncbi:MAG: transporter substrate-binding domain-containing protein [Desulfobacteraceae bacterium]|nr:transporter substrate-binding domain-containing protein [Desulfobacteraceae bacterium]
MLKIKKRKNKHMKKQKLFIIFCFLFLFCLPVLAVEKNEQQAIRVGIFSLEPINYLDRQNKAQGFYPTLIHHIASLENWTIKYVHGSWAQCLNRLQTGEIDLMTTIAFSKERAKTMDFSKVPVVDIWGQVFALPGENINTILDLNNQKVAIMKKDINGTNFISTAGKFGVYSHIVEFDSHQDIFKAIKDKKVVAGIAPQHFGLRHSKKFNIIGTSIQFSPFSVYFATKKGQNNTLLKKIDSHLTQWKNDKFSVYYQELSYWMGGGKYSRQIIPNWIIISLIIIGLISILLFSFNRMLKTQVIKKTNELQKSEEHYRELVESANSIILRWDSSGDIIFINQFGLDLFRYSNKNILGENILNVLPPLKEISEKGFQQIKEKIVADPEKYTLTETKHLDNNNDKIFIQWSNKAIMNNDGSLQEVLSIGTDISQRKQLKKQLVQSQKMEAIGTLAGGIAHDFNNILSVILGNAELASSYNIGSKKIDRNLDKIITASYRASELTAQILAFSRKSDLEKISMNLSAIVKEALNMIRSTLPSTIEIKSDIFSKKNILANPTQIHQVILNMCTNAFHAMENDGGVLKISLKEIDNTTEPLFPNNVNMQSDEYLLLEFSDTGCGIDKKILKKIFDPYFTTKKIGKGTGMGLSVAHGIIKEHNGHIFIQSSLNKGTIVHIYLPVNGSADLPKIACEEEKISGGNETILIIDDEKAIVDAVTSVVSNYGYKPFPFTNSIKALSAFKDHPNRYDLILTDMTMPDMTGSQLSREALAVRPDTPIIMCTGYSELIDRESALEMGISEYLQKPVLKKELLKAIRKTLDTRQV